MSQPITDRPALDSILSQFAMPADEQNSRPTESNGERHDVNGAARPAYVNGGVFELETVETNGHVERQLPFAAPEPQNGQRDPSIAEPADANLSEVHHSNGNGYV